MADLQRPLSIKDCLVIGDLNLAALKGVNDLEFEDVQFQNISLASCTFARDVIFSNCTFEGSFHAETCRFEGSLIFQDTKIPTGKLRIYDCKVVNNLRISNCQLCFPIFSESAKRQPAPPAEDSELDLAHTVVGGDCQILDNRINIQADGADYAARSNVTLAFMMIAGTLDIKNTSSTGFLATNGVKVDRFFTIQNCLFNSWISWGLSVKNDLKADGLTLSRQTQIPVDIAIQLSNSKVDAGINLQNIDIKRPSQVLITRSSCESLDISNFKMPRLAKSIFDKPVLLDGTEYKHVDLSSGIRTWTLAGSEAARQRWDATSSFAEAELHFNPQVFKVLEDAAKNSGYSDFADRFHILSQDRQTDQAGGIDKVFRILLRLTSGYGREPLRIMWIYFSLLLMATILIYRIRAINQSLPCIRRWHVARFMTTQRKLPNLAKIVHRLTEFFRLRREQKRLRNLERCAFLREFRKISETTHQLSSGSIWFLNSCLLICYASTMRRYKLRRRVFLFRRWILGRRLKSICSNIFRLFRSCFAKGSVISYLPYSTWMAMDLIYPLSSLNSKQEDLINLNSPWQRNWAGAMTLLGLAFAIIVAASIPALFGYSI